MPSAVIKYSVLSGNVPFFPKWPFCHFWDFVLEIGLKKGLFFIFGVFEQNDQKCSPRKKGVPEFLRKSKNRTFLEVPKMDRFLRGPGTVRPESPKIVWFRLLNPQTVKTGQKGVQKPTPFLDPLKNARCKGAHLPPKKSTNGLLVFGVILATFFDPLWPKLSKYVTYPMINFRPLKKGVQNRNVFLAFWCILIFFLNFS